MAFLGTCEVSTDEAARGSETGTVGTGCPRGEGGALGTSFSLSLGGTGGEAARNSWMAAATSWTPEALGEGSGTFGLVTALAGFLAF